MLVGKDIDASVAYLNSNLTIRRRSRAGHVQTKLGSPGGFESGRRGGEIGVSGDYAPSCELGYEGRFQGTMCCTSTAQVSTLPYTHAGIGLETSARRAIWK